MTAPVEKAVYSFVQELEGFQYSLSGPDRVWNVLCPVTLDKWQHVHVMKYKETFFVSLIDTRAQEFQTLEVVPGKVVRRAESFSGYSHSAWGQDQEDLAAWGPVMLAVDKLQAVGRLDFEDYLKFEVTKDTKHPEIETVGTLIKLYL